jgi:coproporphyrinogen III oxidase
VESSQQQRADSTHTLRPLHHCFVPLDALLEFVQSTWLTVAKQGRHLRLQNGKVGEDLGFKIGHGVGTILLKFQHGAARKMRAVHYLCPLLAILGGGHFLNPSQLAAPVWTQESNDHSALV